MLKAGIGAVQKWVMPGNLADPDVVLHAAMVSVWGRWFIWLVGVFLLAYRSGFWFPDDIEYLALPLLLAVFNGLVHYRLLTNRPVTWRWMLVLSATDIALITAGIVIGGGFTSFIFLAYYPALAVFAVVFSSHWLSLAWTTTVAVAYAVVCLQVGSGLDLDAGNEKVLVGRLAVMYLMALAISFITRFERVRWQTAVTRERELRRERIELSQTIHDTTAQTAYMIGLGIHRARELAGDSNEDLTAKLDATSLLSKTAIWELRHPIDMGRIFDGRELGWTLDSHVATFRSVTSVSAELTQNGVEPPLSTEAKSLLFTIAHNALTNAFRHAGARLVQIELDFGQDELTLSVSDDGVGLPDDYEERGHGFENMRAYSERLGGRLIVESRGPDGGASVSCVMPLPHGKMEG